MDELRSEFETWAFQEFGVKFITHMGSYQSPEVKILFNAWVASARRADKWAREDVIQLLENMSIGTGGQDDTVHRAVRIIRSTIQEEE